MMFTLNPLQPTVTGPAFLHIVPASDALRCQLFESAHLCKDEFGTAADPPDPAAVARYSRHHQVHGGVAYSEAMIVSDDRDANCNSFHKRKVSGPFREADSSACFILFDHPFTDRHTALSLKVLIEPLLARKVFLRDQLQLSM